ncbi:MAG: hypothetical protein ABI183_01125 [Polyangiaceae bacterium]
MGKVLKLALGMLSVMPAIACASKPQPQPIAQAEVPIRTQEEIARDQSSGASLADPAQCASQHPPANCPKTRAPDTFANTTRRQRLPRMLGK